MTQVLLQRYLYFFCKLTKENNGQAIIQARPKPADQNGLLGGDQHMGIALQLYEPEETWQRQKYKYIYIFKVIIFARV